MADSGYGSICFISACSVSSKCVKIMGMISRYDAFMLCDSVWHCRPRWKHQGHIHHSWQLGSRSGLHVISQIRTGVYLFRYRHVMIIFLCLGDIQML